MKQLNLKSYDDVLLYSQVPKVFEELGNLDKSNLAFVNLLGVYRAQYLLELFGHKGNIYILQDYNIEKWAQNGGQVFTPQSQDYKEDSNEYAYKLDIKKIKLFDDIKNIEKMHIFHEQNFGKKLDTKKKSDSTKRGSICGLKKSTPIMVDTRPWLMRKALFEPPYT